MHNVAENDETANSVLE